MLSITLLTTVAHGGMGGGVQKDKIQQGLDSECIIDFVRSMAPFVDLSMVDSDVLAGASKELEAAISQNQATMVLKTLYRVVKSYNTKSSQFPKLMPATLIARCLSELEYSTQDLPCVCALISQVMRDEAVVQMDALTQLVDSHPTYFAYLAQNVYRGFFHAAGGDKFAVQNNGTITQVPDDNTGTISFAITTPDSTDASVSVNTLSISGGTNTDTGADQAPAVAITGAEHDGGVGTTAAAALNVTGGVLTSGTAANGAIIVTTGGATNSIYADGTIVSTAVSTGFSAGFGTEALPSYTFTTDTDTGMYRKAANTIGMTAQSKDVLLLVGSALTADSEVTITNAIAPAAPTIVSSGAANTPLTIQAAGTSTLTLDSSGAGTVAIADTNATTVNIGRDAAITVNIDGPTLINDGVNRATSINTGASTGTISIGNTSAGAVILNSGSTIAIGDASAGAVTIDSGAGISLDGAAASNFSVSGAGNDLTLASAAGSVKINATEDVADAIALTAAGGTTTTLSLTNTPGTAANAIDINATAGGVAIDAALGSNFTTAAGTLTLSGGGGVTVTSTGGTLLLNGTGQTVDINSAAFDVDASGAATIDAAAASNFSVSGAGNDLTLASAAGSVKINATESAAGAIALTAAGGAATTLQILNTAGTGADAIDITATAGGVTIEGVTGIDITATNNAIDIESGTGTINIGNVAAARSIAIGNPATTIQTIDIGNTVAGSTVDINNLSVVIGSNQADVDLSGGDVAADLTKLITPVSVADAANKVTFAAGTAGQIHYVVNKDAAVGAIVGGANVAFQVTIATKTSAMFIFAGALWYPLNI